MHHQLCKGIFAVLLLRNASVMSEVSESSEPKDESRMTLDYITAPNGDCGNLEFTAFYVLCFRVYSIVLSNSL